MATEDDTLYLGQMLDTARRIRDRLARVSKDEFDSDEDLQLAIAHLLQIIGAAARRVSESTRQAMPQLAWKRICGMRHRLVHDYMDVDMGLLTWWAGLSPWFRVGVPLLLILISTGLPLARWIWPWGWAVGFVLLMFGGRSSSEKNGYRF